MAWWNKIAGRLGGNLHECHHRLSATLYNFDASRSAALLDFGFLRGTYVREQELAEDGSYVDRHSGSLVGPFTSPKAAERFVVKTAWFTGRDIPPVG